MPRIPLVPVAVVARRPPGAAPVLVVYTKVSLVFLYSIHQNLSYSGFTITLRAIPSHDCPAAMLSNVRGFLPI